MPNHNQEDQILDPKELSMEQKEQEKEHDNKTEDNSLNKHLEGPNRPST